MDISRRTQTFRVIGRRTPKVDALDKVTGRTQFGADVTLPRMLVGKVLRSPTPTCASSASIRAKRPQLHNLVGEYNCSMRFEWDDDKQAANLRNHGLDLADAEAVFQHPRLTWLDTREDYGEDRWCSLGMLQGRVVVLVYTERLPDIIRVISLRKATRRERTQYDQFLQDRLGQG